MSESRDDRATTLFGGDALRRMRAAGVAIVGVGLLGGPMALELGTLGVPVLLIDPGVVAPPKGKSAISCSRFSPPIR